ncbi:MAG: protein-disulfide reductase DsbD family protein [Bradymonadia bacterium]|jgi:thiol:disulfide interchange protein
MKNYHIIIAAILALGLLLLANIAIAGQIPVDLTYHVLKSAEQGASLGVPKCDAHHTFYQSDRIHISLMAQCSRVKLGSPLHLKLEFEMKDNWQLYYGPNPGDIAQVSVLDWQLEPGFSAQKTVWPVPSPDMDSIDNISFKYPGDFALYPIIETPNQGGNFKVKLRFVLQLCSSHCAVEEGEMTLEFNGLNDSNEACAVSTATGFRCQRVSETLYRSPSTELPHDISLSSGFAYEPRTKRDNYYVAQFTMTGERRFSREKLAETLFILDSDSDAKTRLIDLKLSDDNKVLTTITSMHCSAKCLEQELAQVQGLADLVLSDGSKVPTRFTQKIEDIRIDDMKRKSPKDAVFFGIDWQKYDPSATPTQNHESPSSSLLWILLLAFIGGLLLNIMPCVLPVLSLKAFALVEETNAKNKRQSTIFYSLGVASGFWALGIALVALKSAGELAGWGFQFQSPIYILIMTGIIFLLSLSLIGVFEIPGLTITSKTKGSGSKHASFMQGLLMTALSTPCSAPFLGTALVFALTRGATEIMLILTLVAAGLVTPVVLLSISPALRRFIPKPGDWMITFKQIVGFVLLATVIYLLAILQAQISGEGMIRAAALLLILGITAWILGKWTGPSASRKSSAIALSVSASLLLAGIFTQDLHPAEACDAHAQNTLIPWEQFNEEQFAQDLAQNRNVLLDFTAAWCPTCKVNETTSINTTAVAQAIAEHGYIPYRIDMTIKNDVGQRWISRFGRAAIPLVVVIPAGDLEKAVILPEIFTESSLLNALKTAKKP